MTAASTCYEYELAGKKRYADPMKVRRVLLEATNSRCWTILKTIQSLQRKLSEISARITDLEQDIERNPTTAEEEAKNKEIEEWAKTDPERKITFEEMPRFMKREHLCYIAQADLQQASQWDDLLVEASMKAFSLPPFDPETGTGCTEEMALQILTAFVAYAEGKGERLGN